MKTSHSYGHTVFLSDLIQIIDQIENPMDLDALKQAVMEREQEVEL